MSRQPEREGLRRRLTGAWQGTRFGERLMARLEAARVRRVTLHSNNLSVEVARVLRGRGSILELASIAAAAAAEAAAQLATGSGPTARRLFAAPFDPLQPTDTRAHSRCQKDR